MTMTLFYQFLVARILERIQQISKEICRGCEMQYKFASLHPCETNSLFHRIGLFLPSAKGEALAKLDGLVKSYKRNFSLFHEEVVYLEAGESFLQNLQPQHLIDTRYINEESESTFGLDSSWRGPEVDPLTQMCNEVFGETDFSIKVEEAIDQEEIIVKRRKTIPKAKKAESSKPIELIADTPGKKKTSPKKPPKKQPIVKRRKSIHKLPCDDPSCCKDSIYY